MRQVQRRAQRLWAEEASGRLKHLLVTGKLNVWCALEAGEPRAVEAQFWSTRQGDRLLDRDEFTRHHASLRDTVCVGKPIFLREEIEREMAIDGWGRPVPTAPAPAPAAAPAPDGAMRGRAGAPPKYDWDAMWIEVVRVALYSKFPDRAADLRKHLMDWFAKEGMESTRRYDHKREDESALRNV